MIEVLYFASLREQLGIAGEAVEWRSGETIASLAQRLADGHERGAEALLDASIRAARNQRVAAGDEAIDDGDEVAFFPPVTGG